MIAIVETMFPTTISENEFFSDLAKGKVIVDHGIKDYFILLDATCFRRIKEIGNTTLKDLVDVFGVGYVKFFRFAGHFDCDDFDDEREEYQSFSIRPATKSDRAKLRGKLTYIPKDTWICDWRDGSGYGMLLPFVQDVKTSEINFLAYNPSYNPLYKQKNDTGIRPSPVVYMKSFIEVLPDYFYCNLAICKYKNVDIAIPIADNSAKYTFKNRDKEDGVKRHIVHTVKTHKRVNSENDIERHLRGRSDITIRGEHIIISSPLEWSQERYIKRDMEKRKRK